MDRVSSSFGSCDESKCVSKGLNSRFNESFTCYGDDNVFPRMCADGFLPVVVEDEPSQMVEVGNGALEVSVNYFTCCPPQNEPTELSAAEGTTLVTRHCSDPIIVHEDESLEFLCGNQENRKYPFRMKSHRDESGTELQSFVCCDSEEMNVTASRNFLDQAECLPYWDDIYSSALVKNELGLLRPVVCVFSDEEFGVPRPYSDNQQLNALGEYQYQCCRTGPVLPPFVIDRAFESTLYPAIVLYAIASIICIIVALSLLVPFWKQWRDRSYSKRTSEMLTSRSSRVSHSGRRSVSQNSSMARSSRKPRVSVYNLYLVHLCLLDLVFSIYKAVMLLLIATQYYAPVLSGWLIENPQMENRTLTIDFWVSASYGFANMSINVIVCHEVFVLLRSSQQAKKIQNPSPTRVNLQVGVVIFLSCVCGILLYYANAHFQESETTLVLILSTIALVQFSYLVFVTITIWKNGYLQSSRDGSSAKEKGLKQLALYFLRIVGVFLVVWVPCTLLMLGFWFRKSISTWDMLLVFWLMALQPILTFGMILTKDDAKTYIVDFVTFSYCRRTTATREKKMSYGSVGGLSSTAMNCSSWPRNDNDPEAGNPDAGCESGDGDSSDVSITSDEDKSFGFVISKSKSNAMR